MKMSDPSQDPNSWIAMWASLPESVKAACLGASLSVIMAFKRDGRDWREKLTDTCAVAVIVLIGGYATEMLGLSGAWNFILGGALGGYGIGPVKALLKSWADKKVDNA